MIEVFIPAIPGTVTVFPQYAVSMKCNVLCKRRELNRC